MSSLPLPIFYLGDSHVRYFRRAEQFGLLLPHEISGIEVGGATAVGLRNPNSKTNAIGSFRKWIRDKSRESIVMIHLGEVDCGYVIWHRASKYNESIESQISDSINAYFEFVDELLDMGFERIIITGATLPTITDDDITGEVVIARSSISATQKERTQLTLKYNKLLEKNAVSRRLPYIDISSFVLDQSTGVVNTKMRNTNPKDHHMNSNLAAVYWAHRINEVISHYQPVNLESRQWSAVRSTIIKAYPAHSERMSTDMYSKVETGQIVQGDVVGVQGEYTIIRNTLLGKSTLPLFRLLHTKHYLSTTLPKKTAARKTRSKKTAGKNEAPSFFIPELQPSPSYYQGVIVKNQGEAPTSASSKFPVSERVGEAWLTALSNLIAVRSPLTEQTYKRLTEQRFTPKQRQRFDRLLPLVEEVVASQSTASSVAPGEIAFGVMGYRCPDNAAASRNIGDWVQTIALMSHFARRSDLRFTGDAGLSKFFADLQAAVPKEKRIAGPSATAHLVEFNRDASFFDKLPESLWAFIFGWYFKLPFGKLEFPFPKNIHPIFISFHVSNANHINDAAIEYLKQHSPIGCRDWHTVRLLHSKGVECYFSGCVTTTIGGLFPAAVVDSSKPVAYVDTDHEQIPPNDVKLTNLINSLKTRPLPESLDMALERLKSYRSDFSKIATSRLHTFLPSESMGVEIDWQPVHEQDRRFDGLTGANAIPHSQMSERITQIVKVLLDGILNGVSQKNIYALYRAEVASDIAESLKHISD
ncbi:hypothetical protein SAMN05192560_2208 [Methylobacillus rhizosphaerae]|uniref:Uncharacterized protein n=1 Tax=Methylobacillus rhizosphaerae TaxID=551994 RepID=A0A239B023_9PROT|nr:hypothetical protein [Methylobacillus rhizosphaerae]SNS00971.1 hypothetical protein SAMN05192560_2208 [Methylobacillus rhizosphaerae]